MRETLLTIGDRENLCFVTYIKQRMGAIQDAEAGITLVRGRCSRRWVGWVLGFCNFKESQPIREALYLTIRSVVLTGATCKVSCYCALCAVRCGFCKVPLI